MPWTEELGGLQPMGSQRVEHDWATKHTSIQTNSKLEEEVRQDWLEMERKGGDTAEWGKIQENRVDVLQRKEKNESKQEWPGGESKQLNHLKG